jgi:DNA-3-methyladenine glycosylase II
MHVIETEADLTAAVAALVAVEPRFAAVVAAHGPPPLRRMPAGLEGLLRIVTDQLISLQAGQAIWTRLVAELAPFDAATLARTSEARLRGLGLSGAKARTFQTVARETEAGRLNFAALHLAPDPLVLKTLTALAGIGPWTAAIYLLSAMGRADAWPAGDLALQLAAQHLFALADRPDARRMTILAAPWQPWRAVAARLLWCHYRGLKGLPQATG